MYIRTEWCGSKSTPYGGQTTLPVHGTATQQSPKDGLNNFWLTLQYNHHVVTPGVILTNPPDNNSCGVCEHPVWHVIIKDNEAWWPHHLYHGGSPALCNQWWVHKKMWSLCLQLLARNRGPGSNITTRARRNPHPVWHARTAKAQATPRPTAGWKEEAKRVKGQEDKTPRKEKRRQKQWQQQKWPAMWTKYSHLPAPPTMLKSQMPSTFPSPDLAHAQTAAQVDITAPTMMRSLITVQSATPPSPLLTVANSKCSERVMCGLSYQMVQSTPRPYSRRQYMPQIWHLHSSQ